VTNLGRVMKDYRESGAFNALVGIHAVIGDGIFLTKAGDLVMWLALKGLDYECADAVGSVPDQPRSDVPARSFRR